MKARRNDEKAKSSSAIRNLKKAINPDIALTQQKSINFHKPVLLFEMFAGFGGASFALTKAGVPFHCIGYSEINKFAIRCYEQNHGKIQNFGNCIKIDTKDLPDFDLLTAGFPCQSFSSAGKGLGEKDSRGVLFYEIIRIAKAKKPKWMLLENVKGLTFKKHKKTFDKILNELDKIGYDVNWKVLNSKEYGVPQNRERVFFVCINRTKQTKKSQDFKFPAGEELKIFLKDILEKKVDEKYYLSPERVNQLLINVNEKKRWNVNPPGNGISGSINRSDVANTLTSSDWKDAQKIIQGGISQSQKRPYLFKNNTKKGYLEGFPGDGIKLEHPNSKTGRSRVLKQITGALLCNDGRGVVTEDFRIRKLTPTEYFRLMGFFNDEINLDGISNSQRYKLAGNGWDIHTVSKIFTEVFKNRIMQ